MQDVPGKGGRRLTALPGSDVSGTVTGLSVCGHVEVALEICHGLGAIHEQAILHRDLESASVMFDGQGRVRIVHFSLAAMVGAVSSADVRSGTPAYMAPE